MIVIVFNAITIFLQESGYDTVWVDVVDAACTIIFLVEMIIKHIEWGARDYWSQGWNRMDGVLVLLSLPSLVTYAFPQVSFNISFLLALRLLRVFRFFRVLHLFPNFTQIIRNVRLAMHESLSIFVGMFVLMVVAAMINCALFHDIAPQYFGTPLESIYSVFRLCTIEGWYDIPDAITANAPHWASHFVRLYFIIILVMLGMIGMSIVNSIFVDAMVSDNNDEVLRKLDAIEKRLDEMKKN